MNNSLIRFTVGVSVDTINELVGRIETLKSNGYKRIHLLISSVGGDVPSALSMFHVVKSLPVDLWTYNIGTVQSSALILYCAGKKRMSIPNSSFVFHPLVYEFKGLIDAGKAHEIATLLEQDQGHMIAVLSESTGISPSAVQELLTKHSVFAPEKCRELGIVHDIVDKLPLGA